MIGYHGHTLIHKPEQAFTFQLGNPELMAQLLKTKVIFNFRDNDIKNKGQGAPLVTLYHGQILKHLNLINNGVIINIPSSSITFLREGVRVPKQASLQRKYTF